VPPELGAAAADEVDGVDDGAALDELEELTLEFELEPHPARAIRARTRAGSVARFMGTQYLDLDS